MSLIKTYRANLIEKNEKVFDDGTKGAYIQLLTEVEEVIGCWAAEHFLDSLDEPIDTEEFDLEQARRYKLKAKEWDGKKKFALVEIG